MTPINIRHMENIHNQDLGRLKLWAGKAAPRYTSYPPAPAFHDGVGEAHYKKALAETDAAAPLSLYIHIPFCRSLCLYCGCNTAVTSREDRLRRYIDGLKHEAAAIRAQMGKRAISHVHFGGGTPNILPPAIMRELFDELHRLFDFSAANEIAMELDPRTVTSEGIRTLADCGITRVSLGVQDFDPEVQAAIGRIQPESLVAAVCDRLRAAGIEHINFDLIYGLPKQTARSVADTAQRTCALGIDRVALFSYAHVPQMKSHQRSLEAHGLPDVMAKLGMEQAARDIFVAEKYDEIGMDHFARPHDRLAQACKHKTMRRNFQGYTDDAAETLVGLGSSSISQLPAGYFQNERQEADYLRRVAQKGVATCRGITLQADDKLRRSVIEQLMCTFSCDLQHVAVAYDMKPDYFADALKALQPYQQAGLVDITNGVMTVATQQRMAVRAVCLAFDAYTAQQTIASRVA